MIDRGQVWRWGSAIVASLFLGGCGGGGGDAAAPAPAPAPSPAPAPAPSPTPVPATLALLAGSLQAPGGSDGVGPAAQFNAPTGVALAADGTVYVADTGNHTIRRIAADRTVTTLAGRSGEAGASDGAGIAARFRAPGALALASNGDVLVSDGGNCSVRRVTPAGVVTTLAGRSNECTSVDGPAALARFGSVGGIAVDAQGHVLVGDGQTLRRIAPDGSTTTPLPCPAPASFPLPVTCLATPVTGVAIDAAGNWVISSGMVSSAFGSGTLARFTPQGQPVPWPAAPPGVSGSPGWLSVPGAMGVVALPDGSVVATSAQERGRFTGEANSLVRLDPAGNPTVIAGANGVTRYGHVDGTATGSRLWQPRGVARAADGRIVFADARNHAIRQLDVAGNVSTIAGGAGYGAVDGVGAAARLARPTTIAAMPDGTLRVADFYNARVRAVTPDGVVTTVPFDVGSGFASATNLLWYVTDVATTPEGRLYFGRIGGPEVFGGASDIAEADPTGQVVRVDTPGASGATTTIAGGPGGALWFTAFNGLFRKAPGVAAVGVASFEGLALCGSAPGCPLGKPFRMAVAADGTLYFTGNSHAVHAVDPSGQLRIVAGDVLASGRVDGIGAAARFNGPLALAVDPAGNVYTSDLDTVRKIDRNGQVSTLLDLRGSVIVPAASNGITGPFGGVQAMAWSGGFLYFALNPQNALMKFGPLP